MSFNKNWPRWIKSSVYNYFKTNKGTHHVYFEGEARKTNLKAYIEIRFDGPFARELSKDNWKLDIEVNVLCSTEVDADLFHIDRQVGDFANLFENTIPVFKNGNGPDDDPAEQIGCLQLDTSNDKRGIIINHYGIIEPKTPLIQATIEGRYFIRLP